MNTNNLKIAWRAAWKTKLFTLLNLFGLAVGFAGFILAHAYINRENSYDAWNPHYKDIYLVGLENEQGKASDLTPLALAPAIQQRIPEVVNVGRLARASFDMPFISDDNMFYVKSWIGADRSIADIFDIHVDGLSLAKNTTDKTGVFSAAVGRKLFPKEKPGALAEPQLVTLLNEQSGFFETIHGISAPRPLSNLTYDYIAFVDDLAKGNGEGGNPAWETYIQVRPDVNVQTLESKINSLYQQNVAKQGEVAQSSRAQGRVYLDPLKNLHLRPKAGSAVGYNITLALRILSLVILLLASINFANIMIVQAQKRSKEIGIKKVFGVSRKRIALQFLLEIFFQCMFAAGLACFFVLIGWNTLRMFFSYDFASFEFNRTVIWQLSSAILFTALLSGIYPAILLSGYQPISIMRGTLLRDHRSPQFRNALLAFQFIIAFIFIGSMFVIHQQMDYMKKGDRGFQVDQVVYIKSATLFDKPNQFTAVRNRMKQIPGVSTVTVSTNVPGGIPPKPEDFTYRNKTYALDHIGVDFEYFETLGMEVVEGRPFLEQVQSDTTKSIILNESAVRLLGSVHPLGESIRICDQAYQVVGVVKDSKMYGFEDFVQPTAYTLQTACGMPIHPPKFELLAKLQAGQVRPTLQALKQQWSSINPKDGKYFIYEFVDRKYADLYAGQEQLHQAFTAFTLLIVAVALMGLFGMSAFTISLRQKEVSIRKVLGADIQHLFMLLNKPFLLLVSIAILVATPIAWWLSSKWLNTFAYRVDLSIWTFVLAAVFALILAFITVSYQALRAAVANPVDRLREE